MFLSNLLANCWNEAFKEAELTKALAFPDEISMIHYLHSSAMDLSSDAMKNIWCSSGGHV